MQPPPNPAPSSPRSTVILTVPQAQETLHRLEMERAADGSAAFEVVCGDVATLRSRHGELIEAWRALRSRLGLASRFNDPEGFLRGVAGHHGVPCVLLIRSAEAFAVVVASLEHESLVQRLGYLKLKTPRLRTLRIAETGVLCGPEAAASDVVSATLQTLVRTRAIDHLAIHNLPVDHPLTARIATVGSAASGVVRVARGRWRTRLLDPLTGARLVHHSGKTRNTLRRKSRKLDEAFAGAITLVRIDQQDQLDGFVRDATEIIRQTYQAALGIGVKDSPAYRQLLADLAATQALCGFELKAGDQALAYLVGDVHERTFRLWATSFLPQHFALSPGIVLFSRALDELALRGVALFDFGYGEADYKKLFGSERIDENDWRVYSRSLRGRIALVLDRVTGALDAFARRLLASRGLIQRVKKLWRARLKRKGEAETAEPME